jgi:hypothetical protein
MAAKQVPPHPNRRPLLRVAAIRSRGFEASGGRNATISLSLRKTRGTIKTGTQPSHGINAFDGAFAKADVSLHEILLSGTVEGSHSSDPDQPKLG